MLKTTNVFLDTEPFVARNFSYGSGDFRALAEYSKDGTISVLITDITYREVRKKIADRVRDAKNALDQVRSSKSKPNVLILRGAGETFSGIFRFDEPAVTRSLTDKFDAFVKEAGIEIVPTAGLVADEVLDKYFSSKPPFEAREDKKREFPDAFCVAAISSWCDCGKQTTYAISGDKGFQAACAAESTITPLGAITELTDLIARALPEQTNLAREWLNRCEPYIRLQVVAEFQALGFILANEDGEVHEVEVAPDGIVLGEPDFVMVDEGFAHAMYSAEVPFTAHIEYDDPDATYWAEGDKYVMDTVVTDVDVTESLDVEVEISFSPVLAVPIEIDLDDAAVVVEAVSLGVSDISVEAHPGDSYD